MSSEKKLKKKVERLNKILDKLSKLVFEEQCELDSRGADQPDSEAWTLLNKMKKQIEKGWEICDAP